MTTPETPRPDEPPVETDDRFPTGPWTGFYVMPASTARQTMDLHLTFREGLVRGDGRDPIGAFLIRGRYQVEDGKCWFSKRYVGKHDVAYSGYNEGRGIWGGWTIPPTWHGGFHIWPVAMGDPTAPARAEAAEIPLAEPVGAGVPAGAEADAGAEPIGAGEP